MLKTEANNSILKLWSEAFSLSPSSLVSLYEINIGNLGFTRGVISQPELDAETNTIFRFHNNVKLGNTSIFWQGNEYIASPIMAEGFEITSKGTLPTPKLAITASDEGIPQLSILKNRISQLGDLVGAKVTRIRTFAKFLDKENFYNAKEPDGFAPDPNSEFPRDVFYIDRKSLENKNTIEYELATLLDIEGMKLPGRIVSANTCVAQYRGNGCLYEYENRRNTNEHGDTTESTLPVEAPPVATSFNEYISDLLSGVAIVDKGEYDKHQFYSSGETVYIEHNNIKYYFVCKGKETNISPPNLNYWIADICSKDIRGCETRWAIDGSVNGNVTKGNLPFNGFPSCNRFK